MQDPTYPAYADQSVIAGRTANFSQGKYEKITYLSCSPENDDAAQVRVSPAAEIFVVGSSLDPWGNPVDAHSANGTNGFMAKLEQNGNLLWHTFFGDTHTTARDLQFLGNEQVFVGGTTDSGWGNPVIPYAGGPYDAYLAGFDPISGNRYWNTFLGSSAFDANYGFAFDFDVNSHEFYVAGDSGANWGSSPVNPHGGGWEMFVAQVEL